MRSFLIGLVILFLAVTPVKATRVLSITSDNISLAGDQEMQITASSSGFLDSESIYIKGAFYKEGASNYFGYTKVGDSWVKNGATGTDQYQIKINNWDNKIIVKADYQDSGFSGNGEYKFKVGFYYITSGGNLSPVNWSTNSITVSLSAPSPTPSATPAPTKSPSPTISKTDLPVSTKTFTPVPIISTSELSNLPVPEKTNDPNSVLDKDTSSVSSASSSEPISSTSAVLGVSDGNNYTTFIILVGLGVVFISTSIYMAYQTQKSLTASK